MTLNGSPKLSPCAFRPARTLLSVGDQLLGVLYHRELGQRAVSVKGGLHALSYSMFAGPGAVRGLYTSPGQPDAVVVSENVVDGLTTVGAAGDGDVEKLLRGTHSAARSDGPPRKNAGRSIVPMVLTSRA
jgi:hypothetical protein